jgi:hypothetical protein
LPGTGTGHPVTPSPDPKTSRPITIFNRHIWNSTLFPAALFGLFRPTRPIGEAIMSTTATGPVTGTPPFRPPASGAGQTAQRNEHRI